MVSLMKTSTTIAISRGTSKNIQTRWSTRDKRKGQFLTQPLHLELIGTNIRIDRPHVQDHPPSEPHLNKRIILLPMHEIARLTLPLLPKITKRKDPFLTRPLTLHLKKQPKLHAILPVLLLHPNRGITAIISRTITKIKSKTREGRVHPDLDLQ